MSGNGAGRAESISTTENSGGSCIKEISVNNSSTHSICRHSLFLAVTRLSSAGTPGRKVPCNTTPIDHLSIGKDLVSVPILSADVFADCDWTVRAQRSPGWPEYPAIAVHAATSELPGTDSVFDGHLRGVVVPAGQ